MTNSEIKEIALRQSAEDIGCKAHDFLSDKNVVVPFKLGRNAVKSGFIPAWVGMSVKPKSIVDEMNS